MSFFDLCSGWHEEFKAETDVERRRTRWRHRPVNGGPDENNDLVAICPVCRESWPCFIYPRTLSDPLKLWVLNIEWDSNHGDWEPIVEVFRTEDAAWNYGLRELIAHPDQEFTGGDDPVFSPDYPIDPENATTEEARLYASTRWNYSTFAYTNVTQKEVRS